MVSASIPEPGQGNGRPWTQSWHNCWHQRQSDEMDPNGAKPPWLPKCTQQRNVEPAEKREDKKPSFDDCFDERRNIRCNMVQHGATMPCWGWNWASTRTVRANHRIKRIFYLNRRHHAVRCRNEMSVQLDFFKIIRCNQLVWTKMKHTNKVIYIYIYTFLSIPWPKPMTKTLDTHGSLWPWTGSL